MIAVNNVIHKNSCVIEIIVEYVGKALFLTLCTSQLRQDLCKHFYYVSDDNFPKDIAYKKLSKIR